MELEFIDGGTEESLKVSGKIITCMAVVSINGLMVGGLWANTRGTKRKDMGFIIGRMAEYTKDTGIKGNNMD